MVIGLGLGTLFPEIRPEPASRTTHAGGLAVGVIGLLVGGGLTEFFRRGGSLVLRREAMGFGDVTLMAMIGAFLGWQAAVLTFFLGPFFGLAHALWKLVRYVAKRISGGQLIEYRPRNPFWPLPEHGRRRPWSSPGRGSGRTGRSPGSSVCSRSYSGS